MDIKEAIELTESKTGMKMSMSGAISRINRQGRMLKSDKFILNQLSEHYEVTRRAWLDGDLETVAEFFGIYV